MGVLFQAVELATPADGTEIQIQTDPDSGVIQSIDPRPLVTRIQVTQTVAASLHAIKDAVGGIATFANATRAAGKSVRIEALTLRSIDQQLGAYDLILFDTSPSGTVTDDAAFDPTDADLLNCVGKIAIGGTDYSDFSDNAIAHVTVGLTAVLQSTSLYGCLVVRSAVTYASTVGPTITLTLVQD